MAPRILIVDDDPAQRRILEEMSKRFGFDPVAVDGGEAGLAFLSGSRGQAIDLIVLDLVMPGMDGLEFLERLTAVRSERPVIVQTAQGSIETAIKAMRAGADDFVVKPFATAGPPVGPMARRRLGRPTRVHRGNRSPSAWPRRRAPARRWPRLSCCR